MEKLEKVRVGVGIGKKRSGVIVDLKLIMLLEVPQLSTIFLWSACLL